MNVSATIGGMALIAIGLVMLRFRDRIEAFWAFLLPARRPQWYRMWVYVAGPALLVVFGVALTIGGITGSAH